MKVGAGVGGAVGLLKADEGTGRGLSVVAREDLDRLDLSEAREVRPQLLHTETLREVLHKQVALLLGVLESLLLSQNHHLSLNGSQSWLHVELLAFNFLVVEFLDSSLS